MYKLVGVLPRPASHAHRAWGIGKTRLALRAAAAALRDGWLTAARPDVLGTITFAAWAGSQSKQERV